MKALELFAGSRSFGKIAEEFGWEVFSTDYHPYDNIDLVEDIMNVNPSNIPFIPDVIWASPPCTYFSVASIGKHWNQDHTPKSDKALIGVSYVQKTLDLIHYYMERNPDLIYFMENPRGKLRKLDVVKNLHKDTVTYCQYGDTRMKPTDIWHNTHWTPRPMCKNGDPCHESAPRGSQTGTQGIKGNHNRSKIPPQLCFEIIETINNERDI